MNNFDNTVNLILVEDWKSAAAAGLIGLGSMVGTPNVQSAEPVQARQVQDTFLPLAFDYIQQNEGLKLMPYKDHKGIPTIGIGHKILSGEDFSKGITKEDAKQLFYKDVKERVSIAKRIFPKFDSYPDYLKVALLDGVFRGDHKSKYRTTKLINAGKFADAAKEYLNHNDYRTSKKSNSGVWKRMERNSNALQKFASEQK